jgi:hypothetical protein
MPTYRNIPPESKRTEQSENNQYEILFHMNASGCMIARSASGEEIFGNAVGFPTILFFGVIRD